MEVKSKLGGISPSSRFKHRLRRRCFFLFFVNKYFTIFTVSALRQHTVLNYDTMIYSTFSA